MVSSSMLFKIFVNNKFTQFFTKPTQKKLKFSNLLFLSITSYTSWYYYSFFWETAACEIHCEANEFNQNIISNLESLRKVKISASQQGFKPCLLLPSAFLQMTFSSMIEPRIYDYKANFDRQLYKLPDGGVVALDWLEKKTNKNLVIITHGLTGGSESAYIQQAASFLSSQGFTVVCFNQRGVSNSPLLNSRYHCHGDTEDLADVINSLKKDYDQIYGVGISMGGNLLMKYAGMTKELCPLEAIVSVGNPYDLQKCSENILQWQNKIYDYFITLNFKRLLKKNVTALKAQKLDLVVDLDRALESNSTYDFDEYFTRRINKFKDVQELYDFTSCSNLISQIKVPVLCLHSKDDPIVPYNIIPLDAYKKNPNIIMAVTNRGGHIEFYSGLHPERVKNKIYQKWIMNPTNEFLRAIINQKTRTQEDVSIQLKTDFIF